MCSSDLLVLCGFVPRPRIGVILFGKLAVGAFQLLLVSIPLNTENIVIVTFGHGAVAVIASRPDLPPVAGSGRNMLEFDENRPHPEEREQYSGLGGWGPWDCP